VLELAQLDACQVRALGRYFGDSEEAPCGHCSWCERGPVRLPERPTQTVDQRAISRVTALAAQHADALSQLRQRARFLCGLSSPALTAARLTRAPGFGALSEVPFYEVLAALQG
jgi:ATP-dependent DNA helicase RecQ